MSEYLVKITIPSVQGLIDRSRKLKDLTGGSSLIPTILKEGLKKIKEDGKVKFIIPTAETLKGDDLSITNVVYLTIEGDKQEVINKVDYLKESILKELDILINKVKEKLSDEDFKEYETLINYQIKNAINVVWAIAEVEGGDLFKAKERVDIALANAKSLIEPDYTYIEGFNLFQKHKNQYKAFKDYQDFLDKAYELNTKELLRGAYLCDVCGKRVIIGATENDFKRSILEDDKDRLCAFCYGKRHFHENYKKSVVDVAITKYLKQHKDEIKEVFEKHDKSRLFHDDRQNIYIEILEEENEGEYDGLIKDLKRLYEKIGNPPKYYAILMMDGDSMGEKITRAFKDNNISSITQKLSEFGKKVKEIVKQNDGELVYTGGDDVFALFPSETALHGYKILVEEFKKTMKDTEYNFTASAGLVFAHYKIPLSYVLQETRASESKAKKVDGKDAVYIKYIKHSYSSAEAPIKNDHLDLFEKLLGYISYKDFPFGFAYQLQELLLPYLPDTDKEDQVKKLTEYLINKKSFAKKEDFKEFMLNTHELFDFKSPEKIINILKLAKFIASEVKV